MAKAELWHEIHSRFRLKEPKRSIARSLGISVQTVRRILRQSESRKYERKRKRKTLLSDYEGYIRKRLVALGYCAQDIFEELQEMGYQGSYETFKRYIQPLWEEDQREATLRFETPPGKQAQVDWDQCWMQIGAKHVKGHLFVTTLGYRRRLFVQATLDERLATFLECHLGAFDHFGGVPLEILYDNTKSVVVERDFKGCHQELSHLLHPNPTPYR
ncbi:IS21 family transposase [Candidatus Aminicenantes bacterium AC-334-K16]|nr:IS21 family transposase [Candidatus Aminicenantes bacterium AC-334-K16]